MRPVITFLTDFGPAAPAVCRGVMFGISPDANIIDINHQVPRYSIREGAGRSSFALKYMPVGTHVAVVDPGVGTERLPIGLQVARGDVLIGPDNGLLMPAAGTLGGVVEARALENRELMLPVISSSFHGRDIFSPMAAHLANGVPFEKVGPTVPTDELVGLPEIRPSVGEGVLDTSIVSILIYGNVTLAGTADDLGRGHRAARDRPTAGHRLPGLRGPRTDPGADRLGAHVRSGPGRLVAVDVRLGRAAVARRQPGRRRSPPWARPRPTRAHPRRLIASAPTEPMAGPLISFLTDFGPESAPAVCRGVMWGIAPDARILDLTHNVRKFAVRDGAFLLSRMVGYLPVGVHVAVVDPGVGTARRPIAIRTARGDALVGPDNGLLMPAARVLGGVAVAYEITASELFLTTVSSTFHGRDIFSPVAAHLANGLAIEAVGPSVDPARWSTSACPRPASARVGWKRRSCSSTPSATRASPASRLTWHGPPVELVPGQDFRVLGGALPVGGLDVPWHATFGDVAAGQPLLYEDADYGGLGISVNQGSAAERYGLVIDTPVRIEAVGA